jgi:hypothetical protein
MDYVPDTASANYLATKGYTYIQGYCQDQWAVDAISELGGWQLPYYASSNHILVPDNSSVAKGLVVLPHATADWIDSYTVWQGIQLHPMNLMTLYNNNATAAKAYFLALIDRTLEGCSPVGFANIQFEWSWCVDTRLTDTAKDWISSVLSHNGLTAQYQVLTYVTFVDWFKNSYKNTPEYRVLFTSPYNASDRIEWYHSTTSRIARIDGYVVSFVDYTKQTTDKYLTSTQYINWVGQMQGDPNNCIDDSLVITISALGGGLLRYPAIDAQRVSYTGDLGSFSSTYYNAQVINTLDSVRLGFKESFAVLKCYSPIIFPPHFLQYRGLIVAPQTGQCFEFAVRYARQF